MAIAFDATSSGEVGGSTSHTVSHTCTGSNLILFVSVALDDNPGDGDCLTGVTYNGVSMTQIVKRNTDNTTYTLRHAYLYYLIAPATGAHNISVTTSASTNIRIIGCSYTGALQSGQPDASTSNGTAANTTITTSLTVVADNSWMVGVAVGVLQLPAASTGVTSRNNNSSARFGDSNGPLAAGSRSMTWTNGGTDSFNILQASFAPAPSASGGFFAFF